MHGSSFARRGGSIPRSGMPFHQRFRAHQVAYICLLARLITLVTCVKPSAFGTAQQANSEVCSTNLALHRPCEPAPGCHALVDDDNRTTLPEATDDLASKSSHSATEVPEDREAGEKLKEAASKLSNGRQMFRVFLKRSYNLTQIVVFCFQAKSENGTNKTEFGAGELQQGDLGEHAHELEVKTWDVPDEDTTLLSEQNASSHHHLLFNASEVLDGGVLRIEFAITQIAAIVAIETQSVCGGRKVAEVAVMGKDLPSDVENGSATSSLSEFTATMSESRRRRGDHSSHVGSGDIVTERRMPALGTDAAAASNTVAIATSGYEGTSAFAASSTAGEQLSGGWLRSKQPSQGLPTSGNNGFLAPTAALATGSQAAVVWFAMMGVSTLALSFLCLSSKWLQGPDALDGPHTHRLDARYRPISATEDQEVGAAGPVFHWIGDSDESQPSSPRPFHSPFISSESEPECELDPSGSELGPCVPSVLGRPAVLQAPVANPHANLSIASSQAPAVSSSCSSASSSPSAGAMAGGRVALLYASPLCHVDKVRGPMPMTQIPFEREWEMLIEAAREAATDLCPARGSRTATRRRQMTVELAAELLTAKSLQRCVAPSCATAAVKVLHLSAHGVADRLVLENGKGTAHLFGSDNLGAMLKLRQGSGMSDSVQEPIGLRLVVLNACSSRSTGLQFVEGGVPHVICSSVDIRDSVSGLFLRALYSSLFQGCTVAAAFDSAIVALRSDPDIEFVDAFRLLPDGESHEEILFPPEISAEPPLRLGREISNSSSGSHEGPSSDSEGGGASSGNDNASADEHAQLLRPRHEQKFVPKPPPQPPPSRMLVPRPALGPVVVHSPFGRIVPPVPEDFVGRSLDVWSILQHLSNRRVVVVCGSTSSDYGIGKSAVLDAAHRAYTLQVGGACIAVHLRSLSDPDAVASAACEGGWIEKVMEQVHKGIQDRQRERRRLPSLPHSSPGNSACGNAGSKDEASPSGNMLRRRLIRSRGSGLGNRAVRHGFHPLSDPIAAAPALEALVSDMLLLSELCEARCGRDWPAGSSANSRILLILDECDHLIQQEHFQEAVADLLRRCPAYRVLLSTQQPMHMVSSSLGQFKVVHHALQKLTDQDGARLFLRRAGRPIRWEELMSPRAGVNSGCHPTPSAAASSGGATSSTSGMHNPSSPVALTRENEAEVLSLVSAHPCVKAQAGNPRRLIELASRVTPSLEHLNDLPIKPTASLRSATSEMAGLPSRPAKPMEDEVKSSSAGLAGWAAAGKPEEIAESSETSPLIVR